ncbi:MAG: ankyrin repeat domain-containing protein [Candidatus Micrarchaeota archaeon]
MPKRLYSSRHGGRNGRVKRKIFAAQHAKLLIEKRQRALNEELLKAVMKRDKSSLLDAHSKGAEIDWRGPSELTPLMWACRSGFEDIAEALMDLGAEVNASDLFGRRPLDFAVGEKHHGLAGKLKARGAEEGVVI